MRRLLLSFLTIAFGCAGETVRSAEQLDAGADAKVCGDAPGNLVQNPSFEIAPGGVLSGWSTNPKSDAVQRKGGAAQCEAWAEVAVPAASPSFPFYFQQEINVNPPLPQGTKITATMMARTLDADLSGLIEVGVSSGGYEALPIMLNADGSWREYSIEWTLPAELNGAELVWVAFVSESAAARRIGIDKVTFVVTRP